MTGLAGLLDSCDWTIGWCGWGRRSKDRRPFSCSGTSRSRFGTVRLPSPLMPLLYRIAVTVTRRQPYLDWANSVDEDGPMLSEEFANDRRTVYLVAEPADDVDLAELLD